MNIIELQYPLLGQSLPTQYGYGLYGALSRLLPRLHEADCLWRVGPVSGTLGGNRSLRLDERSRLRLRLPDDQISQVLPLAGKALEVDGHRVRLGVPQVHSLTPASTLVARLVLLKLPEKYDARIPSTEQFLDAVRRALAIANITAVAALPLARAGERAGQPRRGVLRVKGKAIVGYAVLLEGLSAEDSLAVQEQGLGGRRKMGAGFFVPVRGDQR